MAIGMTKKRKQTPKQTASSSATSTSPSELPTFLDHVRELRQRLFWVVVVILVVSSGAYPFLDNVIGILTAPLGSQQLYYLTPVGGFSFSIQLCLYVGIMASVPFIMYHLYRYLEPLMGKWRKPAVYYVGLSSLFAITGLLFAYFISLPSALHFLTGLNLSNIQAMLTVDSYLTFVMTYMLGAALLFQIPLLLLIINNMTPLQPGKLMKLQKFVIVGAFIVAAIISPTPDIINQLMLALPIVLMYQLGVAFVWVQNRRRSRRAQREQTRAGAAEQPLFEIKTPPKTSQPLAPLSSKLAASASRQAARPAAAPLARRPVYTDGFVAAAPLYATNAPVRTQPLGAAQYSGAKSMALDGMSVPSQRAIRPRIIVPARPSPAMRTGVAAPANRAIQPPKRTIDGFMPYRSASPVSS